MKSDGKLRQLFLLLIELKTLRDEKRVFVLVDRRDIASWFTITRASWVVQKNNLFVYSRSWKRDFFFLKKFSASCTKFRCFHVRSFTCSSSFSMAAARITSGPLQWCLIKKLSPIQSWDQPDPYLTAYSMVLMQGLIFSIWRHFPLAPIDDIFLGELMLLMHWTGDTVEDRHKWRLSQLVRMIWSRVAICKVSGEIFE